MIAFIKTPIQGVSPLCRKLCVHASVFTHQNNASLYVNNDSFYDTNEHIHALNEMVYALNDVLYDVNEKTQSNVPALSYVRSLLSILITRTNIRTHDIQCVIKGVFYVLKDTQSHALYALYELKALSLTIQSVLHTRKRDLKSAFMPIRVPKASFHVIKDVYYVIKDNSYVSKGNNNDDNERSMMPMNKGREGFGTCNEAIMRGGSLVRGWL